MFGHNASRFPYYYYYLFFTVNKINSHRHSSREVSRHPKHPQPTSSANGSQYYCPRTYHHPLVVNENHPVHDSIYGERAPSLFCRYSFANARVRRVDETTSTLATMTSLDESRENNIGFVRFWHVFTSVKRVLLCRVVCTINPEQNHESTFGSADGGRSRDSLPRNLV